MPQAQVLSLPLIRGDCRLRHRAARRLTNQLSIFVRSGAAGKVIGNGGNAIKLFPASPWGRFLTLQDFANGGSSRSAKACSNSFASYGRIVADPLAKAIMQRTQGKSPAES